MSLQPLHLGKTSLHLKSLRSFSGFHTHDTLASSLGSTYNEVMTKLKFLALMFNTTGSRELVTPLKLVQERLVVPIETTLDRLKQPCTHEELNKLILSLQSFKAARITFKGLHTLSTKIHLFAQVKRSLGCANSSCGIKSFALASSNLGLNFLETSSPLAKHATAHQVHFLNQELDEAFLSIQSVQYALSGILYTLTTARKISSLVLNFPLSMVKTMQDTLHERCVKQRKIYSGDFGVVYEVTLNEEKYALKLLKTTEVKHQATLNELANTMKFSLHSSPFLITSLGFINASIFGEPQCYNYGILMPLLSRKNLQDVLNFSYKNPDACTQFLPKSVIRQILLDVAHALKHLHDHGIVHGDLKPANITFSKNIHVTSPSGHAVLLDLGLSHPTYEPTISGSILFSPPEYLSDSASFPIRGTSPDIWSYGVLTLMMISGKALVDHQNPIQGGVLCFQLMKDAQQTGYMEIYLSNVFLERKQVLAIKDPKGEFQAIIRKCLQADPHLRPSMDEIILDLQKIST